jgi:hypothetical protein
MMRGSGLGRFGASAAGVMVVSLPFERAPLPIGAVVSSVGDCHTHNPAAWTVRPLPPAHPPALTSLRVRRSGAF